MMDSTFELDSTYVHIPDAPDANTVPVTDDFWATLGERTDLHGGRMICLFHMTGDWDHWEMHPEGDEVLYLLSGALDLVVDEDGAHRTVQLEAKRAFVVPRGRWHTANVREPGELLGITRGSGTEHRPRSGG